MSYTKILKVLCPNICATYQTFYHIIRFIEVVNLENVGSLSFLPRYERKENQTLLQRLTR